MNGCRNAKPTAARCGCPTSSGWQTSASAPAVERRSSRALATRPSPSTISQAMSIACSAPARSSRSTTAEASGHDGHRARAHARVVVRLHARPGAALMTRYECPVCHGVWTLWVPPTPAQLVMLAEHRARRHPKEASVNEVTHRLRSTVHLLLRYANLCLNCETIYPCNQRVCPGCGSETAVPLSAWLNRRRDDEHRPSSSS